METLDCRGQQCPQPVIKTRRLMLDQPAAAVQVLVDDQVARDNISRLAETSGYQCEVVTGDGVFRLTLTPGAAPLNGSPAAAASGPTVVLIGSDQLGSGDAKLGQILMKNFIFTLNESNTLPDTIYFVNGGVKLTVGGSDLLEPLNTLACRGVDIASCGLCLEFFGVKESLGVGRISNMLEIVNALGSAGRVIRP